MHNFRRPIGLGHRLQRIEQKDFDAAASHPFGLFGRLPGPQLLLGLVGRLDPWAIQQFQRRVDISWVACSGEGFQEEEAKRKRLAC